MRTSLFLLLPLAASVAHAASFDCAQAKTPQEKAICASPELSAADDRMATAYRAALAGVPAEMKAQVREGQRAWVWSMTAACPVTSDGVRPDVMTCLTGYETMRTDFLTHMITRKAGVLFVWRSITRSVQESPARAEEAHAGGDDNGLGTLNASWPQAVATTPEWIAWNAAMESAAQKMACAETNCAPGWAAEADVDAEVTVALEIVSPRLATATIENFSDGHGAHPNTYSTEFNWLLKEQRALKPEDVFRAGSGWEQAMQIFCNKDLHAKLDSDGQSYETFEPDGQMAKTLHGIVTDPASWRLGGRGISIVWQKYAVACYACTPEPTTIPWAELKPYLNPEFALPVVRGGRQPQ